MSILNHYASNQLGLSESFFVATNTPGTPIPTMPDGIDAVDDEKALMTIYNSANVNSNVWVIPIYLRLRATNTNTESENYRIAQRLDNTNRYTSGGETLTGVSTAMDNRKNYVSRRPNSVVNFGQLITTPESSIVKTVGNTSFTDNGLTEDNIIELWWTADPIGTEHEIKSVMPVYIGRGCTLVLHDLSKHQIDDPEFEVEFGYLELGHKPLRLNYVT